MRNNYSDCVRGYKLKAGRLSRFIWFGWFGVCTRAMVSLNEALKGLG